MFIPDNVDKTKTFGCDVSFYQNEPTTPHGIDFHKMRAEGASFAIIRAGQNLWTDPQFNISWADARKSGLLVGSYWYLDVRASLRGQAIPQQEPPHLTDTQVPGNTAAGLPPPSPLQSICHNE